MDRLRRLWSRAREARLERVVVLYLSVSFIVLQAVALFVDQVGLPQWTFPFALVLLLVGLPNVLATAYVQSGPRTHEDQPAGMAAEHNEGHSHEVPLEGIRAIARDTGTPPPVLDLAAAHAQLGNADSAIAHLEHLLRNPASLATRHRLRLEPRGIQYGVTLASSDSLHRGR
jgi:hypothetical protein